MAVVEGVENGVAAVAGDTRKPRRPPVNVEKVSASACVHVTGERRLSNRKQAS
jgi:hypothetical protein